MRPILSDWSDAVRALITGMTGFAGSHLADYLRAQGDSEIWGTTRSPIPPSSADLLRQVELNDEEAVLALVADLRPDRIFHLAGQAFVPASWDDPWQTMQDNVRPALNLIRAIQKLELPTRMLCVSSMEVYGRTKPDAQPLKERTPYSPDSPYGVSKLAQDMLAAQFAQAMRLPIVIARPFNHIGARQSERFVAPAFAKQVAEIEQGYRPPILYVGNLEAQRDFSDVRDVVRAYAMLIEAGVPGEAYHVGQGTPRRVREVLDTLLALSGVEIAVQHDPARTRPLDVPIAYADTQKIRTATGWTPQIPFRDSLRAVLDDWRMRVRNGETVER